MADQGSDPGCFCVHAAAHDHDGLTMMKKNGHVAFVEWGTAVLSTELPNFNHSYFGENNQKFKMLNVDKH